MVAWAVLTCILAYSRSRFCGCVACFFFVPGFDLWAGSCVGGRGEEGVCVGEKAGAAGSRVWEGARALCSGAAVV